MFRRLLRKRAHQNRRADDANGRKRRQFFLVVFRERLEEGYQRVQDSTREQRFAPPGVGVHDVCLRRRLLFWRFFFEISFTFLFSFLYCLGFLKLRHFFVAFWEKMEKNGEKKRGLSQRFTRTKQEKKRRRCVRVCVLKRGVEPRTFRELNNISSF